MPDNKFAEDYVGVLLVRGENILIIGDIDIDKEDEPISKLERVQFPEAKKEQKQTHGKSVVENRKKTKKLHKFGLVNEHVSVL